MMRKHALGRPTVAGRALQKGLAAVFLAASVLHGQDQPATTDPAAEHIARGDKLLSSGKHSQAVAEFRRAVRIAPQNAEARYKLGNAYMVVGNRNDAINEYRKAIKLRPDFAEAHNNLGVAMYSRLRLNPIMVEYGVPLNPMTLSLIMPSRVTLVAHNDLEGAVAEFRAAVRWKPSYFVARVNLGRALLLRGDTDEAIAQYREAIHLEPGTADVHHKLGYALWKKGDLGAALEEFGIARRIEPENPKYSRSYKELAKEVSKNKSSH